MRQSIILSILFLFILEQSIAQDAVTVLKDEANYSKTVQIDKEEGIEDTDILNQLDLDSYGLGDVIYIAPAPAPELNNEPDNLVIEENTITPSNITTNADKTEQPSISSTNYSFLDDNDDRAVTNQTAIQQTQSTTTNQQTEVSIAEISNNQASTPSIATTRSSTSRTSRSSGVSTTKKKSSSFQLFQSKPKKRKRYKGKRYGCYKF